MATFVNDLRLTELATGEGSGTWGTTTNTNLSLIGESFSFGTEAITTNADTHTTTIADGSTDPGRSLFLKYTGTLDSACTITIGPNTVSKLWFIENATSGSQNIIISQGSGANITIPNGQTKAIYSDGAGSGAAMVDAFQDLSIPDLFVDDDLTVGDDLILSSDSAIIKFGADADTTLTHTDGSGLTLNSTNKIMFNDASQFIQGSSATVLSLGATDEIDLTATAIDVNGTIDVSGNATLGGTLGVTGAVTADAGISIDNITIDGTEIDLSSGNLTLDVAGNLIIDVDGGSVFVKDDGTTIGAIENSSSDFSISSSVSDKDILFKGVDGASVITALTLDMSAAGAATFNDKITAVGTSVFTNLDISGDVDIDGTTNLDVVDIDGAVDMASTLQVDGAITSSAGATITVADNSAGLTLISTDADNDVGPVFILKRNSSSPADNDFLGRQQFVGKNDADEEFVLTDILTRIIDASDGTEDARLDINTMVAGTSRNRITVSESETIMNEGSVDLDFRVESDGSSHMLFVDAGNNKVGINQASIDAEADALHVVSTGTNTVLIDGTGSHELYSYHDSGGVGWATGPDGSYGELLYLDEGSSRIIMYAGGNSTTFFTDAATIVNEGSRDHDFRVESDSLTHALFVDAGNDVVNIGGTTVEADDALSIHGSGTNTTQRIYNTNAGSGGAMLIFQKQSSSPANDDNLGDIRFHGNDAAGNIHQFARFLCNSSVVTNGSEQGQIFIQTSFAGAATDVLKLGADAVFNEGGNDIGFRVESDDVASMIAVDSGNNFVGVGTGAPQEILHVFHASGTAAMRVSGDGNNNRKCQVEYNTTDGPIIRAGSSGIVSLKFAVDNSTLAGKFDTNADFYTNDGTVHSLSDIRVKTDVEDLVDGLDIVKQLKPRTFRYTEDSEFYNEDTKDEIRYGFVANEVEAVAPQYTDIGKGKIGGEEVDDLRSLSTTKMIPMLVKAIQEQQEQIEELKAEIATFKGG